MPRKAGHVATEAERASSRARTKAWVAKFPHRKLAIDMSCMLRRNYGLSITRYLSMIALQGGRCAICRSSKWGCGRPNVDHDHVTGEVRGLLCYTCNRRLGELGDSIIEITRTARTFTAYLRGCNGRT